MFQQLERKVFIYLLEVEDPEVLLDERSYIQFVNSCFCFVCQEFCFTQNDHRTFSETNDISIWKLCIDEWLLVNVGLAGTEIKRAWHVVPAVFSKVFRTVQDRSRSFWEIVRDVGRRSLTESQSAPRTTTILKFKGALSVFLLRSCLSLGCRDARPLRNIPDTRTLWKSLEL